MASETAAKIAVGVLIGFALCSIVAALAPGSLVKQSREAIEKCQKSLPMDQHCVITAIPEE